MQVDRDRARGYNHRDMELLERAHYTQELTGLLREAGAGHGRLVLLGGEAGVGKTVLVQRFCHSVPRGTKVLVGACDPLSTPRPLGPLVDIAGELGGGLEHLLDEASPRDRIFRSVLSALSDRTHPALVVFEDMHWADEATLDLIRFLGRRLSNTPALLVATYRDDEVGSKHPLKIVMGDLATASTIRRLSLAPLSEAAVGILAVGSNLDVADLHRRTGGNPFFVTEVLAARTEGVPATVRDAVLARTSRLSPRGRETLESSAIIGSRIEPWLLNEVAGDDADVEECISLGMLRQQGNVFAFRHELAREAVLDAIPLDQSLLLHRRTLKGLRSRSSTSKELARLAQHAEVADDPEAVIKYASAAAAQAVGLGAHREASAQYGRVLRFAAHLPDAERAMLLEQRSYQCYLTDQLEEALVARQAALDIWTALDERLKEGENLRWLSRLSWFLGRSADAERFAQAAVGLLESLPAGPQLGMAYSGLSQLRMLHQDRDGALLWGEKAISLAQEHSDDETLVHALNNVGTARLNSGDEAGRSQLERSLSLARKRGLEEHVARAFTNLASAAVSSFEFESAEQYLGDGIRYCMDHDLDSWRLYMLGWHAISLFYRGAWDEATEAAGSVVRSPTVSPVTRIQALIVLGRLRARRGDPQADTVLDEALALAALTGEPQRLLPVRVARAEAAWSVGQTEKAREEVAPMLGMALHTQHPWRSGEVLFWLWRTGAECRHHDWMAKPFLYQMSGDWAHAASEWEKLGCPYEAAQALAESDDESMLRQAFAEFERLGARPAALNVSRRLRALGARGIPRGPRPSTMGNHAGLTSREIEILSLIHEGLRNSEIAERLYVSRKTVDHHVSSILSKLGVGSRVEASREAARLEIIPQSR